MEEWLALEWTLKLRRDASDELFIVVPANP
jgi:hypothetical protein